MECEVNGFAGLHDWRLLEKEPLYNDRNERVGWRLFWYCARCRVFDVKEWRWGL